MQEIIQIKCPFCGSVLSVKNQPGIETKNVTCPICKLKNRFNQYRRVVPDSSGGMNTFNQSHGYGAKPQRTIEDSLTDLPAVNFTIGRLIKEDSGEEFKLKPGRNVIGRKGHRSGADIQIDTAERRSMSREHIVVEVKKDPAMGFVHYISLFKEKVNPTFVGNETLLYGDCLILKDGDIIKLPDAVLRFEIPDEEATTK